jgi:hypothetical protein
MPLRRYRSSPRSLLTGMRERMESRRRGRRFVCCEVVPPDVELVWFKPGQKLSAAEGHVGVLDPPALTEATHVLDMPISIPRLLHSVCNPTDSALIQRSSEMSQPQNARMAITTWLYQDRDPGVQLRQNSETGK